MKTKELLWGAVGIVVFCVMFTFVFRMYSEEGESKKIDYTKLPEDMVNYLGLDIKVVAMDPIKGDVTVRIFFYPKGKYVDKDDLLTRKIYFYVNASIGKQEYTFAKGMEINPMEVSINTYGHITEYPFDKYEAPFFCMAEVLDDERDTVYSADSLESKNIPIGMQFQGSLHGYDFSAQIDTASSEVYSGIDIEVTRAGSTKFFSVFIMIAMWLLSVIVIFLVLSVVVRKRKIELAFFAFISAMIFALPALRNMQPLIPTIGTFSDYVSFFWAESFMALSLFVIVFVWLRRPGEKHEK
jgi:hypothetical protein